MPQRSPDAGGSAYADEPAPLTPKQIATLLDASRRSIMLELQALAPHGDFRPLPGSWCPNEVVGHLIEADTRGFAHDREHLAQRTALTQRLVWPGMGNARRFSEPDA